MVSKSQNERKEIKQRSLAVFFWESVAVIVQMFCLLFKIRLSYAYNMPIENISLFNNGTNCLSNLRRVGTRECKCYS